MSVAPVPWFLDPAQVAADKRHQEEVAAQSLAERTQSDSVAANKAELALKTRQQAFVESQAAQKNAALAAVAAQLQAGTGYSPAPGGVPAAPASGTGAPGAGGAAGGGGGVAPAQSPDDLAAENAGYGRAKERTGLALQSAMKGLHSAMASRGVSGSGIEAQSMSSLFSGGVGALAETDRTMAEGTAGRNFAAGQSALDRNERARQYNGDAAARRLSQLISVYGSAY